MNFYIRVQNEISRVAIYKLARDAGWTQSSGGVVSEYISFQDGHVLWGVSGGYLSLDEALPLILAGPQKKWEPKDGGVCYFAAPHYEEGYALEVFKSYKRRELCFPNTNEGRDAAAKLGRRFQLIARSLAEYEAWDGVGGVWTFDPNGIVMVTPGRKDWSRQLHAEAGRFWRYRVDAEKAREALT